MKKKIVLSSMLLASVFALAACGSSKAELKDGTYSAESNFDDRGWKVVQTITVKDGKITESTFDYEDKDGNKKSENEEYNKTMEEKSGVSSKAATSQLNEQLVKTQNLDDVEVVSGATNSSNNFKASTEALLKAASEGKTETVTIELGK